MELEKRFLQENLQENYYVKTKKKRKIAYHVLNGNLGNHPDFKQIEPDGNTIKIEQIRQLQEEILQKPIASKRKVYIIKDSDLITKEARKLLTKNTRRTT